MTQQVKTPRFYIDIPSYLHATGDTQWGHGGHSSTWDGGKNYGGAELLYMNAANPFMRDGGNSSDENYYSYTFKIGQNFPHADPKTAFSINFCALLNHNIASDNIGWSNASLAYIRGRIVKISGNTRVIQSTNLLNMDGFDEILNFRTEVSGDGHNKMRPKYNGPSIAIFNNTNKYYWTTFEVFYSIPDGNDDMGYDPNYPHQLGSLVLGRYWDVPQSPELKLTMTRRFDGIKKQKTIGGKTLTNIHYDSPAEWGMNRYSADEGGEKFYKYPAFELDARNAVYDDWEDGASSHIDERSKTGLGRKGLRSWNLSFSYVSGDDMFVDYEVSNSLRKDSWNTGTNHILEDDSFNFLWNVTLGGTIPFIFQPDKTRLNTPDQFAKCNIRENSLNISQVAPNVYSISFTIDEIS
tara:strand:+ start:4231 stop:5457 length:1227 start_codon:yes stop_codon:yes gene_type:complete